MNVDVLYEAKYVFSQNATELVLNELLYLRKALAKK